MPANCCKESWKRIPEDEPTFILAARDKLAPVAIRFWISMAADQGVNADKIRRATEHLDWIERFQSEHPERVKLPD